MAKVHEQVEAEFENIERTLAEVPNSESLPGLSNLELAGLAALIHNFYSGIENILKQIVAAAGKKLPVEIGVTSFFTTYLLASFVRFATPSVSLRARLCRRDRIQNPYSTYYIRNTTCASKIRVPRRSLQTGFTGFSQIFTFFFSPCLSL
ncbi:MAG TPA: hypothetical protein VMX36_15200 [Sedimentisphaerales bacterium]|nr:hypothetical protein [Sedimentisphaerales bacterium]